MNPTTQCELCERVAAIAQGDRRDLIADFDDSVLILGDAQFYRGYSVLIVKRHVSELFELSKIERAELMEALAQAAMAIAKAMGPIKLNYECLGNRVPHMHWHLFPRYAEDPLRLAAVWARPAEQRNVTLSPRERSELAAKIGRTLNELAGTAKRRLE